MTLQYVARQRLKVGGRTVAPGDVVPEAATWKNVQAYVNDGSLAVALEVPEGAVENAELKAQVHDLAERVAALEALVAGAGEESGEVEVIDEPDTKDADSGGATPQIDFSGWKRAELDALATEAGIADPEKLPNIPAVIAAIQDTVDAEALAALVANREAQP